MLIISGVEMANKKAEVKSKNRTLYLQENLFNEFSEITKINGRSASSVLNSYMKRIVEEWKKKKAEAIR